MCVRSTLLDSSHTAGRECGSQTYASVLRMSRSLDRSSLIGDEESLALRPIHEGVLRKRGHAILKTWRSRHFMLCGEKKLQYYKIDKLTNTISTLKGEYYLHNTTKIEQIDASLEGREFLFSLTAIKDGAEEVLILSAANDIDRSIWIEALQDVVSGCLLMKNKDFWHTIFRPSIHLSVNFMQDIDVSVEDYLLPSQIAEIPHLAYKPLHIDDWYTLMMVDVDEPGMEKYHGFLHWAIANIKGSDVTSGTVVS